MRRRALAFAVLLTAGSAARADDWSPPNNSEIPARTRQFAQDLRAIGSSGKLSACHHVVQEAEGRAGYAWGAVCTLTVSGKAQPVMLCDDDAIGYFSLQAKTFVDENYAVAKFMETSCMGA